LPSKLVFSNQAASQVSLADLDPAFIKRHKDKNKALRYAITEKFLKPKANQGSQRMEKLSQSLSNHQSQVSENHIQPNPYTFNATFNYMFHVPNEIRLQITNSGSLLQMQEALFQSKRTSDTMDKIMKEFHALEKQNYLKDIKIYGTNEVLKP